MTARPHEAAEEQGFTWQGVTVAGILVIVALASGFGLDVGLVAITVAAVLALIMPNLQRRRSAGSTGPSCC